MESLDDNFWSKTEITKFDFDDFGGSTSWNSDEVPPSVSDDSSVKDITDWKQLAEISLKKSSKPELNISTALSVSSSSSSQNESLSVRDKEKHNYYETVNQIIFNQSCSLDGFKSLKDKRSLIEAAVSSNDGEAIMTVILFLKRTLSRPLFVDLICQSDHAVLNQYISYLKQSSQFDELQAIYLCTNQKTEATCLEYRKVCQMQDCQMKLKNLRFLQDKLSLDADLLEEYQTINEHTSLLERQLTITAVDAKNGTKLYAKYPLSASLLDQSLLTTLYYCCLYHYDDDHTDIAFPYTLKRFHNLTDKQYCYTASKTLSRQKRWLDVEKLFLNKTVFGSAKYKFCIPIEKLAEILHAQGAAAEVLSIFVRNENSAEKRLQLSKKYGCHQVVVDCFTAQKDRQGLLDYTSKNLTHGSPAYYYADSSLRNSDVRWKN